MIRQHVYDDRRHEIEAKAGDDMSQMMKYIHHGLH